MILVKFKAAHLKQLKLQEAQKSFAAEFDNPDYGLALEQSPYSFTGLHDGQVIICAGIHELWKDRAVMWSLLSDQAPKHLRQIHIATIGFIKQAKWRRIEAVVDESFTQGHKWVTLLGFKKEGVMKAYSPDGKDYVMYARVKHG